MVTSLYFAYGINMDARSMAIRCPAAKPVGGFVLKNWELKFYSHATVEPKRHAQCAGLLWLITPECEQSLDRFEGYPSYYTKQTWRQDGQEFFFYEMAGYRSGTPGSSYVNSIADAYKDWRLPRHLLDQALIPLTQHAT